MSFLRELNHRPIAYYPIYRKVAGSTTAGILLSQLMYWFAKKDEFHKTDVDLLEETMLSLDELKNAKKKIKNLSFITVVRKGIPAKTYYKIDWEMYQSCLEEFHHTVSGNPTNCTVEKPHTNIVKSLTKTTTKTTTENKKYIKKEFSFSLTQSNQLENTSQEYQDKLKAYAVTKDGAYSYENFLNHHLAKGSKFKDWSRAYNTWLHNTQKFNKIDPAQFVRRLEHPTLANVFAEYGVNKAYDADTLTLIGEFRTVEREPTREEVESMREPELSHKRDVSGVLGNLANGVRVRSK